MSVVVYHQGVMAADSRAYSGSTHPIGNKQKIHRIKEGPFAGSLLGITTNVVGLAEEFRKWVERGASRDDDLVPGEPCLTAILVKPDGEVFMFSDAYFAAGPLTGDTFTIGSGRKYALGAIQMGADAVQAVEAAIALDVFCGAPLSALNLIDAHNL
ncbi:ATP-dependent protease HslVU (ClpYQ) peptidase subunit [Rhizobium azibense]|nr:ATP-dependent protease HslVU (ClpYQ) peptidase subunit [Rhizobium azibense]